MKKIISLGAVLVGSTLPLFVFAEATTIDSILGRVQMLMNYVVPILTTAAVIYFVWGVVQYITSTVDDAKKAGRQKIINGLVGLFIIVSFWGIISIVKNTFGVTGGSAGTVGGVEGQDSSIPTFQ